MSIQSTNDKSSLHPQQNAFSTGSWRNSSELGPSPKLVNNTQNRQKSLRREWHHKTNFTWFRPGTKRVCPAVLCHFPVDQGSVREKLFVVINLKFCPPRARVGKHFQFVILIRLISISEENSNLNFSSAAARLEKERTEICLAKFLLSPLSREVSVSKFFGLESLNCECFWDGLKARGKKMKFTFIIKATWIDKEGANPPSRSRWRLSKYSARNEYVFIWIKCKWVDSEGNLCVFFFVRHWNEWNVSAKTTVKSS